MTGDVVVDGEGDGVRCDVDRISTAEKMLFAVTYSVDQNGHCLAEEVGRRLVERRRRTKMVWLSVEVMVVEGEVGGLSEIMDRQRTVESAPNGQCRNHGVNQPDRG